MKFYKLNTGHSLRLFSVYIKTTHYPSVQVKSQSACKSSQMAITVRTKLSGHSLSVVWTLRVILLCLSNGGYFCLEARDFPYSVQQLHTTEL